MTPPRRRWSFGLRTLFVVVTVIASCVWLGIWIVAERDIVQARKKAVEEIAFAGGVAWSEAILDEPEVVMLCNDLQVSPPAPVPMIRRVFGDVPICSIQLSEQHSNGEQVTRLHAVFPEAVIQLWDEWRESRDRCY